jgi:sodium-coupled monocarboxylate transporter 8/12
MIATEFSAISFIGGPAWVFEKDLRFAVAGLLLSPIALLVAIYLFLPFLAKLKLFTVYEYLERRFSVSVRTVASGIFMVIRGGWLANAIFVQSMVISVISGQPLWVCVFLIGGLSAVYTIMGGIEAVDVMQFFVLALGIGAMFAVVMVAFHGNFGNMWRTASDAGHTRMFDFSSNMKSDGVFWALMVGNLIPMIGAYGSDQLIVQRYLSTNSKKAMSKALLTSMVLGHPLVIMLYVLGLGMFGYYQLHPALRADLTNVQQLVPHFIVHALPVGLAGLVIAGLLAATMSSLSAGLNSLSTATFVDFVQRFRKGPVRSDRSDLSGARWCTVIWSLLSITAALFVSKLGGIIETSGKINCFFTGPLIGMFLLGMLTKRANSFGVLCGAALGALVTWGVSTTSINWLWYAGVGCFTTMLCGYLISLLRPTTSKAHGLTVWDAEEKPLDETVPV